MKKVLQYLLFIILLGFSVADSFANSNDFIKETPVEIAQKMCALDAKLRILDRERIIEIARNGSFEIISELKDLQDQLYSDYDSLVDVFQSAVKNTQPDFFYEASKHAWFLYCQDFLHNRGINLSANDRFNYVDALPKEGNATVKLRSQINDTVLTNYLIDSAAYTIVNRYYPNWKNSPLERIQKLDVGIDAFIEFSKNRYIPFTAQTELMNCGPTCLKMVLDQFGKYHSLEELAEISELDETGTSFGDLTSAAMQLQMTTKNIKITFEELLQEMDRPVIAHWENRHFVVVYAMTNESVWILDPDSGRIQYSHEDFCDHWLYGTEKRSGKGSVLIFKLSKEFYNG